MDPQKEIEILKEEINSLKQLLYENEFRQDLIFYNSAVNSILYEYKITKRQYEKIMDVMDTYRNKIARDQKVSHSSFEQEIYNIATQHEGNYHFVEFLTKAFKEENRWEEVFDSLYKNMPKYRNT
jgi:hypothetical protein